MAEPKLIQSRPKALEEVTTHYCPGCGHGIIHRLVAEALDDLGVQDRTCCVAPVGCSVLAYNYFDVDSIEAAHGRAPAVATGVKRANPNLVVFTYQGDGDLAAIGTNEIIHAANRGENFTTIFVNNAIYGMTGGQLAPTTLIDQVSTTTPRGRSATNDGYPIRVCEMISTLVAPYYVARVSVSNPKNVRKAKKAIRKAFEFQVEGKGFTLVEILSSCPTNWGIEPVPAMKWIDEHMEPFFPLGVYRDQSEEEIDTTKASCK
ncbi:MAG: thiamine pyrophosphate-dependent enzyme [Planctomycetota bacterium]|jgi:2-oxoglutarate ferredoxin oxidoreductase subunit beta